MMIQDTYHGDEGKAPWNNFVFYLDGEEKEVSEDLLSSGISGLGVE